MRVSAGKTVSDKSNVRVNGHSGRAPVGKFVRAVSNAAARDGCVQDDWFQFGDVHVSKRMCSGKFRLAIVKEVNRQKQP
jgi:hypothetical protein